MKVQDTRFATFMKRPNRFIAHVLLDGKEEIVHVKNTGRCRELLIPGVQVALEKGKNPNRKTAWDLIAVKKETTGWINMDSQACNPALEEWLLRQGFDLVKREKKRGDSRFDFYLEKDGQPIWLEVKGCTLEEDGVGWFPDAPTTRGTRHVQELTEMALQGIRCVICYVIQINGIHCVNSRATTDPAFARAISLAKKAGVEIWHASCRVSPDELTVESVRRQQSMQLIPIRNKG